MTDTERAYYIATVLGVGGGIGVVAMVHAGMKEGVTDEERKGLLLLAISALGGWALTKAFDLENRWWMSIEGTAGKAQETIQEYVR